MLYFKKESIVLSKGKMQSYQAELKGPLKIKDLMSKIPIKFILVSEHKSPKTSLKRLGLVAENIFAA